MELSEKLDWTYGDIPYILGKVYSPCFEQMIYVVHMARCQMCFSDMVGYYARGREVTLVAIRCPLLMKGKPDIVDIVTTDLGRRGRRIQFLKRMINICFLLEPIKEQVGYYNALPEFVELDRKIYKDYADGYLTTKRLRNIYTLVDEKNVPHTDHLVQSYPLPGNREYAVNLEPRGNSVMPRNLKELLEAIICVLQALVVMHGGDNPIFHRDIQWFNVVRLPGPPDTLSEWILIDWEYATCSPTLAAKKFNEENHAPEVFFDGHGGEVDIWGVGNLITDAKTLLTPLSSNVLDIGQLMKGEKERR
ncbi:hypothetical protein BC938DRAFT_475289 [Jimgerdemannia flammicorona]|uniref:Protein kinase domain-containing protein n=1 Tax=Jimgerdemannia flammicorona TaxID=994334 RepID=A0A433PWZ6_9FUNG|nr:hypothetical protein BC938DRAFT_475289 [Jimgerdemannia flammicorona]